MVNILAQATYFKAKTGYLGLLSMIPMHRKSCTLLCVDRQ